MIFTGYFLPVRGMVVIHMHRDRKQSYNLSAVLADRTRKLNVGDGDLKLT